MRGTGEAAGTHEKIAPPGKVPEESVGAVTDYRDAARSPATGVTKPAAEPAAPASPRTPTDRPAAELNSATQSLGFLAEQAAPRARGEMVLLVIRVRTGPITPDEMEKMRYLHAAPAATQPPATAPPLPPQEKPAP